LGHGARDFGLAALVEKALYERDDEVPRQRLKRLLRLLARPLFNGAVAGQWRAFADLSQCQREAVMRAMASSRLNVLRGAFHDVKQLTSFLAYAHYGPLRDNPTWAEFSYEGHASNPRHSFDALKTVDVDGVAQFDCEVLVIGSGAGGGVMAAELTAAGHDVLVVEKGKQFSNQDYPSTELAGMREMYEGKGTMKTEDRGIVVLAGSTLGGGTSVNWMTCLRPPEALLEQWSHEFGMREATGLEFQRSVESVSCRIHVNANESQANRQNAMLETGCRELGYEVSVGARNVRDCTQCDFCQFGCRHGAKQDTRRTFLYDAVSGGARIVVRANVDRIRHQRGSVVGADLTVVDSIGRRREVRVNCKMIVSAAGSIHTPALLLRSGLENPNIGRNLFLHPVAAVYARYRHRIDSWIGVPQSRVCEQFADLDGHGYGYRLEVSPAHPGLWGLGLPWFSGERHRNLMRQLPYLANIVVLTRDRHPGRVTLNKDGRPLLKYKLHPYDANHMAHGIQSALRVQRAAGAVEIFGPHHDERTYRDDTDADFERFLTHVHALGTRSNHIGMFCAHQMSSCRMASTARLGALSPTGESYDVRNLFVADGSALPTSTGVNPMLTIMSTAHHIAQHVKERMAGTAVNV